MTVYILDLLESTEHFNLKGVTAIAHRSRRVMIPRLLVVALSLLAACNRAPVGEVVARVGDARARLGAVRPGRALGLGTFD